MNNDSVAGFADNSQLLDAKQSGAEHLLHESYEALGEGARAFTHSAFVAPMEGLHQTFEHLGLADKPQTNPEILPPQQFGSGRWLTQQIGGALGFAIPFCIFAAGLRAGTGALKLGIGTLAKSQGVDLGLNYAFRAVQTGLTRTGLSSLEASAAGFGYDMLCKPIAPDKQNFWDERLRHGLSSAVTFGFMHAASDALKRLDIEKLGKTPWLVDTFSQDVQRHVSAGVAGGAVDSLVRTNLTERRAPTPGEMLESMLTFSLIGGAMRTNSELLSRARGTSSLSDVVANDSRLQARVEGNENLSWLLARIGNERVRPGSTTSIKELLRQTNTFKQFGNRDISNNLIGFVADRAKVFEALGEKVSVESDMKLFEQRMRQQNPARGLNSIGATYKQILNITDSQPLPIDSNASIVPAPLRQMLAEQALYLSSRPHEVRQGAQNTCPMASSENRLYTRSPQDVVGVLAKVANGKKVIPDQKNPVARCFLIPDHEADQSKAVPKDGKRLFASQMFQGTLANLCLERQEPGLLYEQTYSKDMTPHETLTDYSKKTPVRVDINTTNVTMETIIDVVNRITGRKETGYVLQRLWDDAGTRKPGSVETLYEQLRHLERTGNLPAILAVDCVNEPFNMNGEGTHVLTVPSFDADGLHMVNQWRRAWNFKLPFVDALIAMADCRDNATLLDKANLINRTRQVENGVQEIEAWRLSKPGEGWQPGQWESGITDCLNENIARWQKRGENFKGEREQTLAKFVEVITLTSNPAEVEDIFKLVNLPRIEIPCPSYDCW